MIEQQVHLNEMDIYLLPAMDIYIEDIWIRNERHINVANLPNFQQTPGSYRS
jgi:hypothetical protein